MAPPSPSEPSRMLHSTPPVTPADAAARGRFTPAAHDDDPPANVAPFLAEFGCASPSGHFVAVARIVRSEEVEVAVYDVGTLSSQSNAEPVGIAVCAFPPHALTLSAIAITDGSSHGGESSPGERDRDVARAAIAVLFEVQAHGAPRRGVVLVATMPSGRGSGSNRLDIVSSLHTASARVGLASNADGFWVVEATAANRVVHRGRVVAAKHTATVHWDNAAAHAPVDDDGDAAAKSQYDDGNASGLNATPRSSRWTGAILGLFTPRRNNTASAATGLRTPPPAETAHLKSSFRVFDATLTLADSCFVADGSSLSLITFFKSGTTSPSLRQREVRLDQVNKTGSPRDSTLEVIDVAGVASTKQRQTSLQEANGQALFVAALRSSPNSEVSVVEIRVRVDATAVVDPSPAVAAFLTALAGPVSASSVSWPTDTLGSNFRGRLLSVNASAAAFVTATQTTIFPLSVSPRSPNELTSVVHHGQGVVAIGATSMSSADRIATPQQAIVLITTQRGLMTLPGTKSLAHPGARHTHAATAATPTVTSRHASFDPSRELLPATDDMTMTVEDVATALARRVDVDAANWDDVLLAKSLEESQNRKANPSNWSRGNVHVEDSNAIAFVTRNLVRRRDVHRSFVAFALSTYREKLSAATVAKVVSRQEALEILSRLRLTQNGVAGHPEAADAFRNALSLAAKNCPSTVLVNASSAEIALRSPYALLPLLGALNEVLRATRSAPLGDALRRALSVTCFWHEAMAAVESYRSEITIDGAVESGLWTFAPVERQVLSPALLGDADASTAARLNALHGPTILMDYLDLLEAITTTAVEQLRLQPLSFRDTVLHEHLDALIDDYDTAVRFALRHTSLSASGGTLLRSKFLRLPFVVDDRVGYPRGKPVACSNGFSIIADQISTKVVDMAEIIAREFGLFDVMWLFAGSNGDAASATGVLNVDDYDTLREYCNVQPRFLPFVYQRLLEESREAELLEFTTIMQQGRDGPRDERMSRDRFLQQHAPMLHWLADSKSTLSILRAAELPASRDAFELIGVDGLDHAANCSALAKVNWIANGSPAATERPVAFEAMLVHAQRTFLSTTYRDRLLDASQLMAELTSLPPAMQDAWCAAFSIADAVFNDNYRHRSLFDLCKRVHAVDRVTVQTIMADSSLSDTERMARLDATLSVATLRRSTTVQRWIAAVPTGAVPPELSNSVSAPWLNALSAWLTEHVTTSKDRQL